MTNALPYLWEKKTRSHSISVPVHAHTHFLIKHYHHIPSYHSLTCMVKFPWVDISLSEVWWSLSQYECWYEIVGSQLSIKQSLFSRTNRELLPCCTPTTMYNANLCMSCPSQSPEVRLKQSSYTIMCFGLCTNQYKTLSSPHGIVIANHKLVHINNLEYIGVLFCAKM